VHGDEDVEQWVRAVILRHLGESPDAADTQEGIVEWWLLEQRVAVERVVENVLEALVAEGLVERRMLPDGTCLYGARRTWALDPERT
jgi:hypothetical protein